MNGLSFLLSPVAPWILYFSGPFEEILVKIQSWTASGSNVRLIVLEGCKMETLDVFYDEVIRKLDLPEYFGRNFNALDECLVDLESSNSRGFVILIKDADEVLKSESCETKKAFIELLWNAGAEWGHPISRGEEWDRPSIPFHTIMVQQNLNSVRQCGFTHEIPHLESYTEIK